MAKVKLSQWHDGNIEPVHIGIYERTDRDLNDYTNFSFWNGSFWVLCSETIEGATKNNSRFPFPSINQQAPWRGIVK